eukprot:m.268465 g.268465  ORF g.268465 m.268465 type:complete len:1415 (+) comp40528_c1_seq1:23-4267(+)
MARIRLILLCHFAFLACHWHFVEPDTHIYVSSTRGSVESHCGLNSSHPCLGFQGFLSRLNSTCKVQQMGRVSVVFCGNYQCNNTCVAYFETGTYESEPLLLVDFHSWQLIGRSRDVIFEGDGSSLSSGQQLSPLMTRFPSVGSQLPGLLYLRNASDFLVEGITFRSKQLFNHSFFALITVDQSRDVTVRGVQFDAIAWDQKAVGVVYPSGSLVIEDCTFQGDTDSPGERRFNYHTVFMICMGSAGKDSLPANVTVRNLHVSRLGNFTYKYSDEMSSDKLIQATSSLLTRKELSSALLVFFSGATEENRVVISNCTFDHVRSISGQSPVTVHFEQASANNSVLIENTTFSNNFALMGGALDIQFEIGTGLLGQTEGLILNIVTLSRCKFLRNQALSGGGAVAMTYFVEAEGNEVIIENSNFEENDAYSGSALFLRYHYTEFVGDGNRLFKDCKVRKVFIQDSTFANNVAQHGAVHAEHIRLEVGGESNFFNNSGGAVQLVSSLLFMKGHLKYMDNKAETGGAISMMSRSQIDVSGIEYAHFENNRANSYGGVLWADEVSTSATYERLVFNDNHTYIDSSRPCFVTFGNERTGEKISGNITLANNTAGINGDTVHAFTFRHCWLANFHPAFQFQYLEKQVTFLTTAILPGHSLASSAPNFLAFEGASCKCFKPSGNIHISLKHCDDREAKQLFSNVLSLATSAQLLYEELTDGKEGAQFVNPSAGIGLVPDQHSFYFPWAWLVYSDETKVPRKRRAATDQPNPSSIILTPSPGEEFTVNFTLKGQFLEASDSLTYMELENATDGSPLEVMLAVHQVGYRPSEKVFFTPNQPLSGVQLFGSEGSKGQLVVRSASHLSNWLLVIRIPFVLARCPIGYRSPPKSVNLQEIPKVIDEKYQSNVSCVCLSTDSVIYSSTIRYCATNATAYVNPGKWIGFLNDSPPISVSNCSSALVDSNVSVPAGVTCYNTSDVNLLLNGVSPITAVSDCVLDYCRYFTSDGMSLQENICTDNRRGPLCGQCIDGFAVTPSSLKCKDCANQYGIIIFLNAFFCLVIVVVFVAFNIKLSPSWAAMLFFTQMASIFVNLNGSYIVNVVNLDFSFGLCFSSNFTALERQAWHYFSPIYTIFLVGLLFSINGLKVKCFSRLLSRRNCLNGLWFVIVLSYFRLSSVAFSFLRCVRIQSDDLISSPDRFLEDASIGCFVNPHLGLFIGSTLLIALILIPFPFAILWARRRPTFKPFGDVYCAFYRDDRWWWCSVDIVRRLGFVLLDIYVPNQNQSDWKCKALTIYAVFLLLIQGLAQPYRTTSANVFEVVLIFNLCVLSVLSSGRALSEKDVYIYVLLYLPWFIALCWQIMKSSLFKKYFKRKFSIESNFAGNSSSSRKKSTEVSGSVRNVQEMKDRKFSEPTGPSGLRDPLLDDNA